jgi:hypothetical protein
MDGAEPDHLFGLDTITYRARTGVVVLLRSQIKGTILVLDRRGNLRLCVPDIGQYGRETSTPH